jgi:hypothetical protein
LQNIVEVLLLTVLWCCFFDGQGEAAVLKPIVDRVLAFDLVQEAHVAMEANSNNGKIVLIVDPAVNAEGEGARSDL